MAMLSRVADSLFWMGRYLERAEQVARQLEVTRDLLVDAAETDPQSAAAEWQATLRALIVPDLPIERLVFDATELSSLTGCVAQARENARQVREVIANEMWEQVNLAHWNLIETRETAADETSISRILSETLTMTAAWDGLTDASMSRSEAWIFLKLGKYLERIHRIAQAVTARATADSPTQEHIALVVLLKSVGALEAYRKLSPTRIERRATLDFVLFQSTFPRSLRFCALQTEQLMAQLDQTCRHGEPAVGRAFGRLASRLAHSDIDEVLDQGLGPYLDSVVTETTRAAALLQRIYFLQ